MSSLHIALEKVALDIVHKSAIFTFIILPQLVQSKQRQHQLLKK